MQACQLQEPSHLGGREGGSRAGNGEVGADWRLGPSRRMERANTSKRKERQSAVYNFASIEYYTINMYFLKWQIAPGEGGGEVE